MRTYTNHRGELVFDFWPDDPLEVEKDQAEYIREMSIGGETYEYPHADQHIGTKK
jgi:hypothetical protein